MNDREELYLLTRLWRKLRPGALERSALAYRVSVLLLREPIGTKVRLGNAMLEHIPRSLSATLDDPTEDGYIIGFPPPGPDLYVRDNSLDCFAFGRSVDRFGLPTYDRGYVEWPIGALAGTITKVEFRYHGKVNNADNAYIYAMAYQPSVQSDDDTGNKVIYDDAGDGTAYLGNNATFPEVGATKDVGGASGPAWDTDPKSDLQTAVDASRSWFAFGFKTTEVNLFTEDEIYSEEFATVNPKPTLYVEYEVAAPENTVYLVKATGKRTQLSTGAVPIKIDPATGRRGTDPSFPKFLVREDDGRLKAKSA